MEKISNDETYNAFTGLIFYHGAFYVAYRQGTGHVSLDGKICVMRLDENMRWDKFCTIQEPDLDVRDPRLYIFEDRLIILAFSLHYTDPVRKNFEAGDTFIYQLVETSQPGKNWSGHFDRIAQFSVKEHKDILWSLAFIGNEYYATGYSWDLGHYSGRLWKAPNYSTKFRGNRNRYRHFTIRRDVVIYPGRWGF
jgi:hypothetical protein